MIKLYEDTLDNKQDIVKSIQNLTSAYKDDELYNQLRNFIDNEISNEDLQELLNILIDENKDEDPDMILNILESEIDSYYRMGG